MLSSISNYFCFNERPSLLLVLPVSLYCFARCVAPKRNLLFCKFYFVGSSYVCCSCWVQANERVDKEDVYHQYLFYIAAPRARLIKNLSSPTRCPEKEKSASESSRAFSVHCIFTKEDYISTLSVEPPELRHVLGI